VIDLEQVYRTHSARVRSAVSSQLGGVGAGLVDDACQDAWLIALRNRSRLYSAGSESVYCYVVKTAIRQGWKLAARQCSACELELDQPDPVSLEGRVIARDTLRLSGSSPRQRRMLWLRALGLSYAEIAAETRSTVRTVDRQLQRGRKALAA
jgi:DNA-directed RNA polymerase specialized sigma24 family protein